MFARLASCVLPSGALPTEGSGGAGSLGELSAALDGTNPWELSRWHSRRFGRLMSYTLGFGHKKSPRGLLIPEGLSLYPCGQTEDARQLRLADSYQWIRMRQDV